MEAECECFIDWWSDKLVSCESCKRERKRDEEAQKEVEKEIERIALNVHALKEIRKSQETRAFWNWAKQGA